MKRFLPSFVLIFALLSQSAFASFSDVESGFHQEASINWLQQNGVVQGYSDGTFQPDKPVNRAEFLKMLYGTMGMDIFDSSVKLPFSDVPKYEWYTKYVKQAYKDGVINGYPDGTFKPENEIDVLEALKIVDEAFLDVDSLYGNGSDFAYCPNGFFTLDEKSLLSENLDGSKLTKNEWYWKYVHVSGELCLFDFALNAWGMAGFLFNSYMDRGDMAEMLYRTKAVHDEYAENGNYKKFVKGMKPVDMPMNEFADEILSFNVKYSNLLSEASIVIVSSDEDRPDIGSVVFSDKSSAAWWAAQGSNAIEGGPDTITVTVYKNSKNLSPKDWVVTNKDAPYIYSNYDSSLNLETLSVDGQAAVKYSWFGLGGADEVVFEDKSGDFMYVIKAHYMSENSNIRNLLNDFVKEFSFL